MAEWHELEHRLWRRLQERGLAQKKILVGCSGGADSLALLWALHRVLKKNISACYVHHGPAADTETTEYRTRAAQFCQAFCESNGIPWHLRQNSNRELRSEEELRDFRRAQLLEALRAENGDFLALAQHKDDLLETRLLRLIRGTGPQGLQAMAFVDGPVLRPFLDVRKTEIRRYLEICSIEPLEDPSNESQGPLRNWLRNRWLPDLEAHQPGALESLSRSLSLLAEMPGHGLEKPSPMDFAAKALSRLELLALPKVRQKQVLAAFVLGANKRDFSHAHIDEVLKRLDNPKNELMFRVGGLDWCVNAQQIWLEDDESPKP